MNNSENESSTDRLQLIVNSDHELKVEAKETSYFQQLCEVCENAEIYQASNAKLAITPRTQLLDRMIAKNKIFPKMFMLDTKQQLLVGNQMVELLKTRLRSWDKINSLIDGSIQLADLDDADVIKLCEIEALFTNDLLEDKGDL